MSELSEELLHYLFWHYGEAAPALRATGVWVMSQEWLDECKRIAGQPDILPDGQLHLIGIPVIVSGAASVPVLVASP